jgi:rhodanese-related sulfurtransferase
MKKNMFIFVIAALIVLPGSHYLSGNKSDYENVCPNNDLPSPLGGIVYGRTVENAVNLKEWAKTPQVSASKFPTGVEVFYKFDSNSSEQKDNEFEPEYSLDLLFSDYGESKSIAYAYAHSGAVLKNSKDVVFILKSGGRSKFTIQVAAEKGKGGVAVVTCKNNRKSIISIDLPGYQISGQ